MSQQAQIGMLFALVLVAVCWALVVGNQLGWGILADPDQYTVLKASMFLAYLGAGLSFCMAVVVAVAALKKE